MAIVFFINFCDVYLIKICHYYFEVAVNDVNINNQLFIFYASDEVFVGLTISNLIGRWSFLLKLSLGVMGLEVKSNNWRLWRWNFDK